MRFTIYGLPKPLKRHRHTKRGFTYDPSFKDKKEIVLQAAIFKPKELIDSPIKMDLRFYFPHPKSHYRSGKYSHLLQDKYCTLSYHLDKKPDLDNCIKMIGDSLEGIFYTNDSLICEIYAAKLYCDPHYDKPRTEIKITTLNYNVNL